MLLNQLEGLTYSSNGSKTSCDKQCGGSTDDTKICVDFNSPCPINYLYFGQTPENPSIPELKQIAVGAYFLYYSIKGSGAPIVETRVTKGNGVCFDNTVQNLYETSKIHQLLNTNNTELCTKTDDRFKKFLTQNEDKLYNINYIENLYNSIPDYQISKTETYSIYTRTFIPLAGNRRGSDISTFEESYSEYYRVYEASVSVLVTSILYLILVGIIYTICSILNILSKRYRFKQYLFDITPDNQENKSSIFKRLLLKLIVSVIHMISLLVAFIIVLQNYILLRNLNQGTVGDTKTVQLYSERILWFIVSNFIYFGFIIILEMLVIVPLCSKKLKENTDVKISKKYMPKPGSNRSHNQQVSQNRQLELPEYQTHNIYGGNGINTTINPFVQQMSVLGVDVSTTNNNRSIHMGPGLVNLQGKYSNNIVGQAKQGNIINQSILSPEIKNYQSYNTTNQNQANASILEGQYRPPSGNLYQNDYEQNKKSQQNLQYSSITNRGVENISAPSQTGLQNVNYQGNVSQNDLNKKNQSRQEQQNYDNQRLPNQNFDRNLSPIPHINPDQKINSQYNGEDNVANQTIDLEFQSSRQVFQQPGHSNFHDEVSDFGMQSSISGDYKKNNKPNQQAYKPSISIDTLPGYGIKGNDSIQPIPEVDSNRHPIDRISSQRIPPSQQDNNIKTNYQTNNQQGNIKSDIYMKQTQSNQGTKNDLNYNSYRDANFDNQQNTIPNSNVNQQQNDMHKQQLIKNAYSYDPTQQNQQSNQQSQYYQKPNSNQQQLQSNQQNQQYSQHNSNQQRNQNQKYQQGNSQNQQQYQQGNKQNNYNSDSFRDQNANQNIKNYNIYSNDQYHHEQKTSQNVQNRAYDKNDQEVDDPDRYDKNIPSQYQNYY